MPPDFGLAVESSAKLNTVTKAITPLSAKANSAPGPENGSHPDTCRAEKTEVALWGAHGTARGRSDST